MMKEFLSNSGYETQVATLDLLCDDLEKSSVTDTVDALGDLLADLEKLDLRKPSADAWLVVIPPASPLTDTMRVDLRHQLRPVGVGGGYGGGGGDQQLCCAVRRLPYSSHRHLVRQMCAWLRGVRLSTAADDVSALSRRIRYLFPEVTANLVVRRTQAMSLGAERTPAKGGATPVGGDTTSLGGDTLRVGDDSIPVGSDTIAVADLLAQLVISAATSEVAQLCSAFSQLTPKAAAAQWAQPCGSDHMTGADHMTVWCRSHDCVVPITWLCGADHLTVWCRSPDCVVPITWLCGADDMTVTPITWLWHRSHDCVVPTTWLAPITWLRSIDHMTVWHWSHDCVALITWLRGTDHMTAWHRSHDCLAPITWLRGTDHMTVWHRSHDYMALIAWLVAQSYDCVARQSGRHLTIFSVCWTDHNIIDVDVVSCR